MKNPTSQGAILSHRYLRTLLALSLAILAAGCKKDKEAPAVIEEVPSSASAAPAETDTTATLSEEPNLQQVGKDKPGSAKSTFHPSGKGAAPSGAAAEAAGFSDAGRFVVQVAIFKSKKQAANLVEKLSGQGYPAYVAEVNDPVPELAGTYHRVRIGKFMKIADARAFGENTLKPLGYDFWIDNKKNDEVGGMGGGYSAPAAEPAAEAPAPRKGRNAKAPEPSEPTTPPGETWGTPKTEEPAAPASESWGTPASSEPAATPSASDMPGANSSSPSAPPTPAPAAPSKPDTGKVNLDEW
jgi:cell division septation protein DedD